MGTLRTRSAHQRAAMLVGSAVSRALTTNDVRRSCVPTLGRVPDRTPLAASSVMPTGRLACAPTK